MSNLVEFLDQAEGELRRIPRAMAAMLPPPLQGPMTAWSEIEYLRELVRDMVTQNCSAGEDGCVESGFISTHAEAIRYLCRHGLLEMAHDGYGRGVWARIPPLA